MARASKSVAMAPEAAAKPAARGRKTRHAEPSPAAVSEVVEAAQPTVTKTAVEVASVDPPAVELPGTAMPRVEEPLPRGTAEAPGAAPEPAERIIAPLESAESVEPSAPAMADPPAPALAAGAEPELAAPVLREVRHLHGITLRFWQDQLQRAISSGQAIMVCRSPQEAVGLQIAYVQATLASGFEHAGQVARLSQDIPRDMWPLRPR